jgi:hypothetical protein
MLKLSEQKKEDKQTVEDRTAAVKEAFKRELGLVVDQRREGGFGTPTLEMLLEKHLRMLKKQQPFVVCQPCWCLTLM